MNFRNKIIFTLFLFTLQTLCSSTAFSQVVNGEVIRVRDGDTFDMMVDDKKVVVRINGIDCPEKGQMFGERAKDFAVAMVLNKNISVKIHGYDRYKRALCTVYLPGKKTLNEELLRAGMAWHFKKYNSDKNYARLESDARKNKVGLWKDPNSIAPWEFRDLKRSKKR